ncbi:2-hydroxychromene-2-carboxylate isomerase [Thalassobium sp. R2A62]|jgi:2-hydroxychromene-2-carboxylate isomerase|uniref:2-hydroxychromene-2-carboxylate isomerase n=1 Tax=Thalassobium sp. R2A62 TaxID=633131 RepID=UPI0001B1D40F|nr:2-hydroxychromene-2-carboxylate isomerase [Thalassobium sp. R2A62]EET48996.1 2-hydroxychromene-2-carboxylate isomerase [Thalassobium sp. R2A62]
MAHIDYYFATLSPFTYMAGTRLEEIAGECGATIAYKPLDVAALFGRTGGTPPKDRHPNRQEYRLQDMRRQASLVGLPINLKPAFWPTNPAPSSYAIIAAANGGGGDMGVLVHAITRAVWAEDRDISQDDVIRDCLSKAGFDPALADADMLGSAETYAANLEEAVSCGAFGVPFYITETDERFWGQDRLGDLHAHLMDNL